MKWSISDSWEPAVIFKIKYHSLLTDDNQYINRKDFPYNHFSKAKNTFIQQLGGGLSISAKLFGQPFAFARNFLYKKKTDNKLSTVQYMP